MKKLKMNHPESICENPPCDFNKMRDISNCKNTLKINFMASRLKKSLQSVDSIIDFFLSDFEMSQNEDFQKFLVIWKGLKQELLDLFNRLDEFPIFLSDEDQYDFYGQFEEAVDALRRIKKLKKD